MDFINHIPKIVLRGCSVQELVPDTLWIPGKASEDRRGENQALPIKPGVKDSGLHPYSPLGCLSDHL